MRLTKEIRQNRKSVRKNRKSIRKNRKSIRKSSKKIGGASRTSSSMGNCDKIRNIEDRFICYSNRVAEIRSVLNALYKQGKTKIKKKPLEQIAFGIFFIIILGLIIYSINDLLLG